MPPTATVLRPLGQYEQYSSSRHSLGLYRNVATAARYALPADLPGGVRQLRGRVEQALAILVRVKLPGLRVWIKGEETRQPVYVAATELDLRAHVEWIEDAEDDDAALLQLMRHENVRPWPDVATAAAWRVVVCVHDATGTADIVFVVHHALADGKSGLAFHRHLVETLREQATAATDAGPIDPVLRFDDRPQIPPPQETLVRFSVSLPFLVHTLWRELGPSWSWPRWFPAFLSSAPETPFSGDRPVWFADHRPAQLHVLHLEPADAATLLAGCRSHGVSLTAALHGLLLVLFARRVPDAQRFKCHTPVSTRRFVDPAQLPAALAAPDALDRTLANMVAPFAYVFEPDVVAAARADLVDKDDDTAVWRAAAALGSTLHAELQTFTHNNIMGLLSYVSDWHRWWRDKEGQPREGTWCVSNTGVVDAGPDIGTDADADADAASDSFRLTRVFYSQSWLGANGLFDLNVSSVRSGCLSLLMTWHTSVVSDAFGAALADDLRDCLARFCRSGSFAVPDRRAAWTGNIATWEEKSSANSQSTE